MEQSIKKNVDINKSAKMISLKDKVRRIRNKTITACMGAATAVLLMSTTCYASGTGTTAVTQPLDNLKTLIIAVIGAVGVIILAKNVMEFAQAYQQQDSSTMNSALKGIVAGVMMAGTTMLANSEFVALLKQANTDSAKMAEVIGVSDAQLRFVTNSQSGMGLLKCGNVVIPFDNQIGKDTSLYKLYNTNIHERIAEQKARKLAE